MRQVPMHLDKTSFMKSQHMNEPAKCKRCQTPYVDDEDDDGYGTGLCYHCFEDSLEEYEEMRRDRIARANEY